MGSLPVLFLLLGCSDVLQLSTDAFCPRRNPNLLEEGRKCRKICEVQEDCAGQKKGCHCDGNCGLSCFNKEGECGEPAEIPNGRVHRNHIRWGGEAYYSCNEGFVLKGSEIRICNADKKWGGPSPTCATGCTRPHDIENSYPTNGETGFLYGQSYDFSCNSGYYMTGNGTRMCISSERGWTKGKYSCHPKQCDPIYGIRNARLVTTMGLSFGSTATIECDEGYEISSSVRSIRCFPGESDSKYGEWKGTLPTCNIIRCRRPSIPEHGSVRDADYVRLEYGSRITYECDTGYKINGPNTGTCNSNKEWGEIPTCIENPDCDFSKSSSPTCGYRAISWSRVLKTEHAGTLGHVAQSDASNSFLVSVQLPIGWTQHFICLKFYYKLPHSSAEVHGSLRVEETSGDKIYWASHENERLEKWLDAAVNIDARYGLGYQFHTNERAVQLDDITGSPEKCTDRCEDKPCQNGGTCVNRISSYTCFCTEDFTGNRCEIDRKCSEPVPSITNGFRSSTPSNLLPQSRVQYSCVYSHKFTGEYGITTEIISKCVWSKRDQRSEWSPNPLTLSCEEITCEAPEVKQNSHLVNIKEVWSVADRAEYACDSGHENWNPETMQRIPTTITCEHNGQWSGSPPDCIVPFCTFDETGRGGPIPLHSNRRYNVGVTILVKCNKGYYLNGAATLTCVRMQSWDEEIPTCQKIRCGTAPEVENMTFQESRVLHFDEAFEYSGCRSQYYLHGSARITCRFDGTFSRPPTCKRRRQCVDVFSSFKHGTKRVSTYRAQFVCDKMYRLVGTSEVWCQDDGMWSHAMPYCQELPSAARKVLNDAEYLVFISRANYDDARQFCENINGKLAKCNGDLTDELENILMSFTNDINLILTGYAYEALGRPHCHFIKKKHGIFDWTYFDCVYASCHAEHPFLCQREYAPCRDNPCANGGICRLDDSEVRCLCADGFEGPNCGQEVTCERPHLANNLRVYHEPHHRERFRPGSKIFLTCAEGYSLVGEEITVCQTNGHWRPNGQWCSEKTCYRPDLPKRVEISRISGTYPVGTELTLGCIGGFKFIGYPVIVCGFDEQWSNIDGSCKEVRCKPPILPRNAVMLSEASEDYERGESLAIGCEAGTRTAEHITCQEDGSWLGLTRIYCERPQLRSKTTSRPTTTTSPLPQTIRQAFAASAEQDPSLGHRKCTRPELPDSGYIIGNTEVFLSGTSITLGCLNGRSVQGDPKWRCQNGVWRKTDFGCVVAFCVIDEFLLSLGVEVEGFPSETLTGKNFNIGEQVTLSCSGSKEPVHYDDADTEPRVTCESGGQWSPHYGDFDCTGSA